MANTWIELDLDTLDNNLRCIQAALGEKTEIIFVVKSGAYNHGLEPVATRAWARGIRRFGVSNAEEADRLRDLLPAAHILILGVLPPEDAVRALERNLVPVVVSEAHAAALAGAVSQPLRCHVKIDTGMGRLGFAWEEAGAVLPRLARQLRLDIQGVCTHFAASDADDRAFTDTQVDRFLTAVAGCEAAGLAFPLRHVSNSGGVLWDPAWDFEAVRPGILLYGYGRGAQTGRVQTRPFLQWKTRVVQVRRVPAGFTVSYGSTHVVPQPTTLAVIDAGYADGLARRLGNRGCVLLGGRRRPIVGRVTMSLTVVDAGPDAPVAEGDEVTLIGRQGGEAIWADELAGWCDTISYEVLTNIRTTDVRVSPPRAAAP